MKTTELIDELRRITQANLEVLRTKMFTLSEEQLKWRPIESAWNINEIFAHLNQYAVYYHQAFKRKIGKTKFTKTSDIFISSPLGKSAWKSMKLGNAQNVKRKFKAPKGYNPRFDKDLVTGQDLQHFERNLQDLHQIIEAAEKVNLRRVKVPISISKMIRLRLGDALLFVVYHNERHVQQALNVVSHPNFPKTK